MKFILILSCLITFSFLSIAESQISCKTLFGNENELMKGSSQNKSKIVLTEIIVEDYGGGLSGEFKDSYNNNYIMDTGENYLKVSIDKDFDKSQSVEKLTSQLISEIYTEQYLRLKPTQKNENLNSKWRQSQFSKTLLLKKHLQTNVITSDIDIFYKNFKISISDLNIKNQLGLPVNAHDTFRFWSYIDFVMQKYSKNLADDQNKRDQLKKLSWDLINRSTLVKIESIDKESRLEHEIGILSVESKSTKYKLPYEISHRTSVRKLAKIAADSILIEVGRFAKNDHFQESSNQVMKYIVNSFYARKNVDYVIIEVDSVRKRLWQRLGFKEVEIPEHLKDRDLYKSGTDHLMIAPADVLYDKFIFQP